MTKPLAQSRPESTQNSGDAPVQTRFFPRDLSSATLCSEHYKKAAVKELQESITPALTMAARDVESDKWPAGLVTAGVTTASCLLWLLIVGAVRLI